LAQLLKNRQQQSIKNNNMKKTFLILAAFWALTLQAQEQKNPVPQISVTGEGKIKIVPDQAVVTVGFQNSGKDAKEVTSLK
jgi:uncharacterized protein YggE